MARTTENTYLIYKATSNGSWAKLVDIKDFPDLGGDPNTVDITTLSHHSKTYKPGLSDPGMLKFTANYDKADYTTVSGLEGKEYKFGVQFGKNAEDGTFVFPGELVVYVNGGGVEEAVDMTISIAPSDTPKMGETTDKVAIS